MLAAENAAPAVSLAEAQAYVRVETGEEEAILAGLIRTATSMCEQFTGRVILAREFTETLSVSGEWQRLALTPVRSIDLVEMFREDNSASPLAAGDFAIDIDSTGDGWVRVTSGARRVRVTGSAGMASDSNFVPEPIRQGVVRLTAHLFNARDGGGGDPPAAVTALWRPYRRMRLA